MRYRWMDSHKDDYHQRLEILGTYEDMPDAAESWADFLGKRVDNFAKPSPIRFEPDLKEHTQRQLALFLVRRYMEDFDTTHQGFFISRFKPTIVNGIP